MLLVMDALLVGKNGCVRNKQKKLGSCQGNMVRSTRKKGRHTIKNIIGGK